MLGGTKIKVVEPHRIPIGAPPAEKIVQRMTGGKDE